MFTILALAAAAAGAPLLKGPVPAAPLKDWLGDASVQGPGSQMTLVLNFALTVSPDGAVVRCTVESSTGAQALDAGACDLLTKRGRFQAAVDGAGKPVMGVYRGTAVWAPQGAAPVFPRIEMVVALQTMPGGLSDPAYVDLAVSTDETGRVEGCATGEGLNWSGQPIPARLAAGKILGAVACGEALKGMKLDPAMNAESKAERSVQTARVLFTAKPAELAVNPDEIVVKGKRDSKTEVKIVPTKGVIRIVDYQAIGNELVAVQTSGGDWYRMELEPMCIGNSRLTKISRDGAEVVATQDMIERLPRELRQPLLNQILDNVPRGPFGGIILPERVVLNEGLGFTNRSDGSMARGDEVVATTIDGQDVIHIESCRISSLTASDPPKGIKATPKKK